jgi:uncharacterized protein
VIERVQGELRDAMRAGDRRRVDALRLVLSSLQRAAATKARGAFTDEEAQAVLRRERKQRVEAAAAYRAAGHEDRAAREEADLPVIDDLLPAPLGPDELRAIVDAAIAETSAGGPRDMGGVMRLVGERTAGRADMKEAAALVRERLGQ